MSVSAADREHRPPTVSTGMSAAGLSAGSGLLNRAVNGTSCPPTVHGERPFAGKDTVTEFDGDTAITPWTRSGRRDASSSAASDPYDPP